ncbi:hypothetical protein [Sorangium sp. So ce590]|uniref:hypothetical protein n=1 Tax=unclassified Sorangium TaxID=2621164 RepID=UPI003F6176D3
MRLCVQLSPSALLFLSQEKAPTKASAIGARLDLSSGEVTLEQDDRRSTGVSGIPLRVGAERALARARRRPGHGRRRRPVSAVAIAAPEAGGSRALAEGSPALDRSDATPLSELIAALRELR